MKDAPSEDSCALMSIMIFHAEMFYHLRLKGGLGLLGFQKTSKMTCEKARTKILHARGSIDWTSRDLPTTALAGSFLH